MSIDLALIYVCDICNRENVETLEYAHLDVSSSRFRLPIGWIRYEDIVVCQFHEVVLLVDGIEVKIQK